MLSRNLKDNRQHMGVHDFVNRFLKVLCSKIQEENMFTLQCRSCPEKITDLLCQRFPCSHNSSAWHKALNYQTELDLPHWT